MGEAPLRPEFQVHILNDAGVEAAKNLARLFSDHLDAVEKVCQPGREFAIVKTKLEEACFFAKKALASKQEFQKELN